MNEKGKIAIDDFFNAILTDEALAAQVAELAEKAGYHFTAADLLELGEAQPISDDETVQAAGGLTREASARVLTPQRPVAWPGQHKIDDLVYRPNVNQPMATTMPYRSDDTTGAEKPMLMTF